MRGKDKKRIAELRKEIYDLEHQPDKAGQFEPELIPLYREMQGLYKKQRGEIMAVHQTVDKNGFTRIFNNEKEGIEMGNTKENIIHGTTCPSCGVFTPDGLAINPKEAQKRWAANDMYEALKAFVKVMATDHGKFESFEAAMKPIVSRIREALALAEGKNE